MTLLRKSNSQHKTTGQYHALCSHCTQLTYKGQQQFVAIAQYVYIFRNYQILNLKLFITTVSYGHGQYSHGQYEIIRDDSKLIKHLN